MSCNDTNHRDAISFQLLKAFLSVLTLLIGQLMKLADMLIHPAAISWLSVAGSALLVIVLSWLVVKLGGRMRKMKKTPK